jgi:hypothetical protein
LKDRGIFRDPRPDTFNDSLSNSVMPGPDGIYLVLFPTTSWLGLAPFL